MVTFPNGSSIQTRQDGWIKPHIVNLVSRGGPRVFICFNDYPAGRELGHTEGFGLTMREAFQDWLRNGGKTGGFQ